MVDLLLGILAIVLGLATFQTGGTDPATVFGLVLAGMGLALIVGALVGCRFGGASRR